MTSQQLELPSPLRANSWRGDTIALASQSVPVLYRRNNRALRYRLTFGRDGLPRITIPRRGSRQAAEQFALCHHEWLLKQLEKFEEQRRNDVWTSGTQIMFRGEMAALRVEKVAAGWQAVLGAETFPVNEPSGNVRPEVEAELRSLAACELAARAAELSMQHGCKILKVAVRAQVSRWGSCSKRGTISLNWRLVQVPSSVRDYVILHELMHLREMNHSSRFWALVARACPTYKTSEAWLRQHSQALL